MITTKLRIESTKEAIMKYLLIFLIASVLYGCESTSIKELQRVTSPNNKYDGVLVVEMSGGAAGSVSYEVYIVKMGKRDSYNNTELAFEAVGLKDQQLSWTNNNTFELKYSNARVLKHNKTITLCDNGSCQDISIINNLAKNMH